MGLFTDLPVKMAATIRDLRYNCFMSAIAYALQCRKIQLKPHFVSNSISIRLQVCLEKHFNFHCHVYHLSYLESSVCFAHIHNHNSQLLKMGGLVKVKMKCFYRLSLHEGWLIQLLSNLIRYWIKRRRDFIQIGSTFQHLKGKSIFLKPQAHVCFLKTLDGVKTVKRLYDKRQLESFCSLL